MKGASEQKEKLAEPTIFPPYSVHILLDGSDCEALFNAFGWISWSVIEASATLEEGGFKSRCSTLVCAATLKSPSSIQKASKGFVFFHVSGHLREER